jgi:hypothetical protein
VSTVILKWKASGCLWLRWHACLSQGQSKMKWSCPNAIHGKRPYERYQRLCSYTISVGYYSGRPVDALGLDDKIACHRGNLKWCEAALMWSMENASMKASKAMQLCMLCLQSYSGEGPLDAFSLDDMLAGHRGNLKWSEGALMRSMQNVSMKGNATM